MTAPERRRGTPPLPIGTIRPHKHNGGTVREIKVSNDRACPRFNWMPFARFWWEMNKGPIPAGMVVAHEDGDGLNDDPSNLILVRQGEQLALWHINNEAKSEAGLARAHKATAVANRLRSRITRARRWLPSRWYPVDLARRAIHNRPLRDRLEVFRDAGLTVPATPGGKYNVGALFGWEGLDLLAGSLLAAAVEGAGTLVELLERANAARADLSGRPPAGLLAARCSVSKLKLRGLVSVSAPGGRRQPRTYTVTPKALETRGRACPVVPIRGGELEGPRFRGFAKLGDDGQVMGWRESA